jgi:Zn-dependent peptidase ImmA (M78 family)
MLIQADEAIHKANTVLQRCGTRDATQIAAALGIIVMPRAFAKQKGVYKIIQRNRFIFIKQDLDPVMREIVLLHEIGHDALHRHVAGRTGGFHEFSIFDVHNDRMEYEANLFAAQIALPDDEILEYIHNGYDVEQTVQAMRSDVNLVALKVEDLNRRGYAFREQECDWRFLR